MSEPEHDGRPRPARAGVWAGAGAVVALAIYTLLFFAPAALQGGQFFFRDVSQNHYPMRCFQFPQPCTGSTEAGDATLEMWNPHLTFGQPSLANPNTLSLHPTTLLFLVLPFDAAFRWGIILHYLLAAVGAWLLLRDLGAGASSAWLAGVAFAFSGPLVSLGNLYNLLGTAAWLPLTLYLMRRAAAGRGPGWWVAAAASLAVQVIAGEPLLLLGTLGLGAALCAVPGRDAPPSRSVGALRALGVMALLAVLAAGMAAAQILPTLDLLQQSDRGAGFAAEMATKWSTHPLRLVELLVPGWFGDPTAMLPQAWWGEGFFESSLPLLLGVYLGGPVILLASLGALGLRREPVARALGMAGILSLLLALGSHAGLFLLLRLLPGAGAVRYPSKFLLLVALCVAGLAALGLDRVRRGEIPRAFAWVGGAVLLLPVFLALIPAVSSVAGGALLHGPMGALGPPGGPRDAVVLPQMIGAALRAAAVIAVALALIGAAARGWLRPAVTVVSLAALVAADLYAANAGLNPTVHESWYEARPPLLAGMRGIDPGGRLYRHPRPRGFALRLRPGVSPASAGFLWDRMSFRNASGLQYGVNLAFDRNNEGLGPRSSALVSRELEAGITLDEKLRILRLGATRFVLSYEHLSHPDLRLVEEVSGAATHPLVLYELLRPLRRARLVGLVERAPDLEHGLARVRDASFDPATSVLLPGPKETVAVGAPRSAPASVVRDRPGRVEVRTSADFDGYLVLADSGFSGWRAELDGVPVAIESAYHLFRAVRVPAGDHAVSFTYAPRPVVLGRSLSIATLLGSVLGAALLQRRRRIPAVM